jgi:hypothetical protein
MLGAFGSRWSKPPGRPMWRTGSTTLRGNLGLSGSARVNSAARCWKHLRRLIQTPNSGRPRDRQELKGCWARIKNGSGLRRSWVGAWPPSLQFCTSRKGRGLYGVKIRTGEIGLPPGLLLLGPRYVPVGRNGEAPRRKGRGEPSVGSLTGRPDGRRLDTFTHLAST